MKPSASAELAVFAPPVSYEVGSFVRNSREEECGSRRARARTTASGDGLRPSMGSKGLISEQRSSGVATNRPLDREALLQRPLAVVGLEDVVDVDGNSVDAAFVDLDLVEVRGGVDETLRRTPIVLPVPGSKAGDAC